MPYRALIVDSGAAVASFMASGSCAAFVDRVERIRAEYEPAQVWCAWDCRREDGWRRAAEPTYKSARKPSPNGLSAALSDARDALSGLGWIHASAPGCEADDVLYSLSRSLPGPVLLVSADKDLLQAIRPGVDLLKLGTRGADQHLTAESLPSTVVRLGSTEVTGLDADGWRSLLALAGDSTDGVPGLPGVGPTKALAILRACPRFVDLVLAGDDTVARMVAGADATTARWVETAIGKRDVLRLSATLTGLRAVEVTAQAATPAPATPT